MAVPLLIERRHQCCLHTCDGVQFGVRSEGVLQFAIVVYTAQSLDDTIAQDAQRIPVAQNTPIFGPLEVELLSEKESVWMQHDCASLRCAHGMSPSSSVSSRLAWKTIAVFCTVD